MVLRLVIGGLMPPSFSKSLKEMGQKKDTWTSQILARIGLGVDSVKNYLPVSMRIFHDPIIPLNGVCLPILDWIGLGADSVRTTLQVSMRLFYDPIIPLNSIYLPSDSHILMNIIFLVPNCILKLPCHNVRHIGFVYIK